MYEFIVYVAHNVLINMACPCVGNDVLLCCCVCRTFDVKLSLSSNMVAAYDSLYVDGNDVQWFGCLLLDIFMGKSVQGYEVRCQLHCLPFICYGK